MLERFAAVFPAAETYGELIGTDPSSGFAEAPIAYSAGFHWSERHLQCIWFDSRYRPELLHLANGETAKVLDPGEWNLEAGPDFINAVLLVQPGDRRLAGDVEVHIRPTDWDAHRHASDPAYRHVIAHVTWFAGPQPKTLPPAVCRIALIGPLQARTDLSLDDIDLKAYPHAILPETPRPCEAFLRGDPDTARALLTAAGHYRLREKAIHLLARIERSEDRDQILYEEVMAALGYKHNQAPFRLLARLLPAQTLVGLDRDSAFASFLGLGRLLPQPETAPDEEGRQFLRSLWDIWWRLGGLPDDTPAPAWELSGLRPQNAPARRLAAAAALFAGIGNVFQDIRQLDDADAAWFEHLAAAFRTRTEWPYWQNHLAFTSKADARHPAQLLGDSRIAAIITNVLLPFALATNLLHPPVIRSLPPEDLSAPMRETAHSLFGRDHNPALYSNNGLLQQGLLQIHQNFCLNARTDCARCSLYQTLNTNQGRIRS